MGDSLGKGRLMTCICRWGHFSNHQLGESRQSGRRVGRDPLQDAVHLGSIRRARAGRARG